MKTPIRIIVAADLKGTSGASGTCRVMPNQTDDLFQTLKPSVTLSGGNTFSPEGMADFEVAAVQSKLGATTAEETTKILHDKAFQHIEAGYRGIDFLATKLPEEGVILEVLDTSYEDLRQRILDDIVKPEYAGRSDVPATVILGDFDFNYKPASMEVLADLAKMGEAIHTPFVAQTGADFFNLKHLLHLPTIKNPLEQLSARSYAAYHEFRETDTSFWCSLMLNRFLLRAPYDTEEYKEPASAGKPEQYLFARGIWVLGANMIKSFAAKEHLVGISGLGTGGEQLGLPYRALPLSRQESVNTPLEASLPIDIVEGLPYLGISPLSQIPVDMGGQSQPGMIYLHLAANLKHIPDPEGNQFGLLTVHASIAYSLMMGRVIKTATKYITENGPEGAAPSDLVDGVKAALLEDLWTKEPEEITVEAKENGLAITYRPNLVIHTRRFEIDLDIPVA